MTDFPKQVVNSREHPMYIGEISVFISPYLCGILMEFSKPCYFTRVYLRVQQLTVLDAAS